MNICDVIRLGVYVLECVCIIVSIALINKEWWFFWGFRDGGIRRDEIDGRIWF